LGWRQNGVALVFPYFLVLGSIAGSAERRRTLLALFIPSVALIYVKGDGLGYWIQVCGGRFWGNVLMAAAVLVAYYAANAPRGIQSEDIAEIDHEPEGLCETALTPRRKSAA